MVSDKVAMLIFPISSPSYLKCTTTLKMIPLDHTLSIGEISLIYGAIIGSHKEVGNYTNYVYKA